MSNRIADIRVPPECREMIRAGALVAVSHSGGKDSQAMTILLSRIAPPGQLVVVHAPLGEVEWEGIVPHVEATLPAGVPLVMAPLSSGKSLLDHVEERGKFPGIRQRWCTATHKRGPIERELRRYLKANPRFGGRLVNCLGLRRDESAARAKRVPLAAQRAPERRRARGLRLAADLPSFDGGRVPRHPRRGPVPALDLPPSVAMQLLLLHFLLAQRSAPGGRAPPRALPALRGDRAPHRPHPVALRHPPAGTHGRFPVRGRRRRGRDGSWPHPIPAGADAAAPRTARRRQASVSEEWSGAGVPVKSGRPEGAARAASPPTGACP